MPLLHAKVFSPSASKTWMNCAGAPLAQEGIPNLTTDPAEEGTSAHALGETVLADPDANCADYLGELIHVSPDGKEWFVDEDMVQYVQEYVDYCRGLVIGDAELMVEVQVNFGDWIVDEAKDESGEAFGTADCVVIADGHCHVADLKYGQGIGVVAEGNSQALIYALGVYAQFDFMYDFDQITVHIIQPRKGGISTWTISVEELMAFGEKVKAASKLIAGDNPQRTPGDAQCEWCRARKDCKPHAEYMMSFLSDGFELEDDFEQAVGDVKIPSTDVLSNDEIGALILRKSAIVKFFSEAMSEGIKRAELGEKFTNVKPVLGRGSFAYDDADKAVTSLVRMCGIDEARPRKPVTVAVAKKLLTKKGEKVSDNTRWMKAHVVRKEGSLTLVAMSDKRSAVEVVDLTDGF